MIISTNNTCVHLTLVANVWTNGLPDFIFKFSEYNCPQKSKHRKRELGNVSNDKLSKLNVSLREIVTCSFSNLQSTEWQLFLQDCVRITEVIDSYCVYLGEQNARMFKLHRSPQPSIEEKVKLSILPCNQAIFLQN